MKIVRESQIFSFQANKAKDWRLICSWRVQINFSSNAMHYGNIFEYLSLWSEVQFLKIQKSKKIQEIQKPN